MRDSNCPSNSAVRRAGSTLRAFARGQATLDDFNPAVEVIQMYRSTFTTPLVKVNNGLRSFTRTLKIDAEVSQRLKRLNTIYEKLTTRETGLDLSRMRDIGGCRVVAESNDPNDFYALLRRMDSQWKGAVKRVIDYVEVPRESGYRAIHVEVERDARRSQAGESGLAWTAHDSAVLSAVQDDVQSLLSTFLGGKDEIG